VFIVRNSITANCRLIVILLDSVTPRFENKMDPTNRCRSSQKGNPVIICPFFLEDRCKFGDQCHNLHPIRRKLSKKNKPKINREDDDLVAACHQSLNRKMRTASDVIHRIQWDPALNVADFRVIYLDRFTGLGCTTMAEFLEQNSDEPTIPQHRIQQICYCPFTSSDSRCGWVVWEKQSRTDYVFGSGGGATIKLLDLIRHASKTSQPV
jgi:uncharacterized protein (UPF0248 family)